MYANVKSSLLGLLLLAFVAYPQFAVVATVCKDGTVCQHGSPCEFLEPNLKAINNRSKNGIRTYKCDCKKASLGHIYYSGMECEYEANDYCLIGASSSTQLSFCTNGKCVEKHMPDDHELTPEYIKKFGDTLHKGCVCDDGYVGNFCQYKEGEEPIPYSNVGLKVGLSITIASVVILFGSIYIRKRRVEEGRRLQSYGGVTDC